MAASDAGYAPVKNSAYRVYFPIFDADGDLVTSAGSLDSEVSLDGGTFADCSNEATEVATSSGVYYLDLTAAEMNADSVVVIVKSTSGKTTPIFLYPVVTTEATFGVNTVQISGDSTAADNLELQYDTTGLTGDTFPATQLQVAGISSGSGSVNTSATSDSTTTTGTPTGTYTNTLALDGTYHQIADAAGTISQTYQFNINGGLPSAFVFTGRVTGSGDDLTIEGYDEVNSQWVQIGTLAGTNSSSDSTETWNCLTNMVGSGANAGRVRCRLSGSGLSSANLYVDQILCQYIPSQSGYENGAVWFDDGASNTNTQIGIDGVATNAVSTVAAVNTLLTNTNLHSVHVAAESTVTFAASQQNENWFGPEWTLALGSQDVSGSRFEGASRGVSGTCAGATSPFFKDCSIGAVTAPPSAFDRCGFTSTLTLGSAGDFFLIDCFSQIAGASSPTIDMGAAVGASNLSVRRWSGGLTINNLASGDVVSLDGTFGTITLNGADAQVEIRGIAKAVTNNLTGSPTVNDDSVKADSVEAILTDTADIQPKVVTMEKGIIEGTAQTGTLSTTQMTTDLSGYADDELIGRVVVFTGGTADGQATDITDYASASGLVTFTAITTAPVNADTFKIV